MVTPFCDQIMDSTVTLHGTVPNDGDILDPEPAGKGGKTHKQKHKQPVLSKFGKTFQCEFFLNQNVCYNKVQLEYARICKCVGLQDVDVSITEINSSKASPGIRLCGSFYTCAYVPLKTTVSEAIEVKLSVPSTFKRYNWYCFF